MHEAGWLVSDCWTDVVEQTVCFSLLHTPESIERLIRFWLGMFKVTHRGSQELEGTLFPSTSTYSLVSASVGASDPMTSWSVSSGLLSLEN